LRKNIAKGKRKAPTNKATHTNISRTSNTPKSTTGKNPRLTRKSK